MKIVLHKDFTKQLQKLSGGEQEKFYGRLEAFEKSSYDAVLNNHPLKGKYAGCRSINITGDLRAIYKMVKKEVFIFIALGTHGNLYE